MMIESFDRRNIRDKIIWIVQIFSCSIQKVEFQDCSMECINICYNSWFVNVKSNRYCPQLMKDNENSRHSTGSKIEFCTNGNVLRSRYANIFLKGFFLVFLLNPKLRVYTIIALSTWQQQFYNRGFCSRYLFILP